jgi:hypothetical protein
MVSAEAQKKSFRQFPPALKLVVIWIFLLSLLSFWRAIDRLISAGGINISAFVGGAVYFYLAMDLAERGNISRILASVVIGIGTIVRLVLLILIIAGGADPGHFEFGSIEYPATYYQVVAFLCLNILFNAGLLYILLNPDTKAFFARSLSPAGSQESK